MRTSLRNRIGTCILPSLLLSASTALGSETKSKYGPQAIVLSRENTYFRANPAPDFWALIPYYVQQRNGSSCSLASVAMVVNAARVGMALTADDRLISQAELLKKVGNSRWSRAVGAVGTGVTLDELGAYVLESVRAYGFRNSLVEVVRADSTDEAMEKKLRAALVENEKSAADFIIINFNQQVYTGDAQVGHISPIAAYDASQRRVLVLDPDREWYEPYWVSEKTLLAGMATKDRVSGKNRGWIRVSVR